MSFSGIQGASHTQSNPSDVVAPSKELFSGAIQALFSKHLQQLPSTSSHSTLPPRTATHSQPDLDMSSLILDRLRAEIRTLTLHNHQLQDQLAESLRLRKVLEGRVDELSTTNKQLETELEKLLVHLRNSSPAQDLNSFEEVRTKTAELSQTRTALEQASLQRATLDQQCTSLTSQLHQAQERLAQATQTAGAGSELQAQVIDLTQKNHGLEERCSTLSQELEKMGRELASAQRIKESANQAELQELRDELAREKANSAQLAAGLNSTNGISAEVRDTAIETLQKERAKLHAELIGVKKEVLGTDQLKKSLSDVRRSITDLRRPTHSRLATLKQDAADSLVPPASPSRTFGATELQAAIRAMDQRKKKSWEREFFWRNLPHNIATWLSPNAPATTSWRELGAISSWSHATLIELNAYLIACKNFLPEITAFPTTIRAELGLQRFLQVAQENDKASKKSTPDADSDWDDPATSSKPETSVSHYPKVSALFLVGGLEYLPQTTSTSSSSSSSESPTLLHKDELTVRFEKKIVQIEKSVEFVEGILAKLTEKNKFLRLSQMNQR